VPCLVVADVDEAMRFYAEAFGAIELYRSPCAGGAGMHLNVRIWNSLVCLTQEEPRVRKEKIQYSMLASPGTLGGSSCVFQIQVPDADEAFEKAVRSGAAPSWPPVDMFWGDRYSLVQDPFGYMWAITTVQQVLTPAEVAERLKTPVGGK
jgi:PhnB protein